MMNYMRNVIVTADGNPFAINLWYENFKKWSNEIDIAYVSVSSNLDGEIVKSIENIFYNDKKIKFIFQYKDPLGSHAQVIHNALSNIKDGNVLLLEHDIFINESGFINKYFEYLESRDYEVIGSDKDIDPTSDLYKLLKTKYDFNSGYFPSMLFFNIKLMEKIRKEFDFFYDFNLNKIKSDNKESALFSATYCENTIFTFLNDYKLENSYSDEITNIFGILLKLNSKKRLNISWLANRHVLDFNKKYENWVHIGCIGGTSGIYGSLRKKNNFPIFEIVTKMPAIEIMFSDCYNENVKPEWERRMGYFLATYESWNHLNLLSLKEEYLFGIQNFSQTFNLSWNNICKYKESILSNI